MTAVATDERQRVTLAFAALVSGAVGRGANVMRSRFAGTGP